MLLWRAPKLVWRDGCSFIIDCLVAICSLPFKESGSFKDYDDLQQSSQCCKCCQIIAVLQYGDCSRCCQLRTNVNSLQYKIQLTWQPQGGISLSNLKKKKISQRLLILPGRRFYMSSASDLDLVCFKVDSQTDDGNPFDGMRPLESWLGSILQNLGATLTRHLYQLSHEWEEHQTNIWTRRFDLKTFSEYAKSWRNRNSRILSVISRCDQRYISGLIRCAYRSRQLSRLHWDFSMMASMHHKAWWHWTLHTAKKRKRKCTWRRLYITYTRSSKPAHSLRITKMFMASSWLLLHKSSQQKQCKLDGFSRKHKISRRILYLLLITFILRTIQVLNEMIFEDLLGHLPNLHEWVTDSNFKSKPIPDVCMCLMNNTTKRIWTFETEPATIAWACDNDH